MFIERRDRDAIVAFLGLIIPLTLFIGCPAPRPTVEVEVCAVSGVLPNPYCPEKILRRYYTDEKPTTVCTVHKAPEPPIGKPVPPFVGASVYQGVVFDLADVLKFLDDLKAAEGNATEVFFHFSWVYPGATSGAFFSTFVRAAAAWYADPTSAYGSMKFPLFDLGVKRTEEAGYVPPRNEVIWQKWAAIFRRCYENGIAVFVRFEDFCSLKDGASKRSYPFRANTLRLGADGVTPNPADRTWYNWQGGYEAAVRRSLGDVIDALNNSGSEYFLIPMNEADTLDTVNQDAAVMATHDLIITEALRLGMSEDHIVISTSRALDAIHARWPAAKIELHGCNSPERMNEYRNLYGPGNTSFNGDGFDPNAQGIAGDNPGKRQPSIAQGEAMGMLARAWGAFAVLFFARETESMDPPDIRRVSEAFSVVKAMAY